MRRAGLILLALLASACTTPQASATPEHPMDAPCDVEVTFGSYAMGIDHDLATRVRAFVDTTADVEEVEETHWGREGETTLCLTTANATATDRVYDRIAGMIPQYSDRAPTSVTHHDGRSRASGMPPGRN